MQIKSSTQFKRDLTKVKKGRYADDVKDGDSALAKVLTMLVNSEELPRQYNDQPLASNWKTGRDCHINPGLILIYKVTGEPLNLARIGIHSDKPMIK